MPVIVTIAADHGRFEQIIHELEPVVLTRRFLLNAIYLRTETGYSIIWKDEKPVLVKREAILISGTAETGGNFDTYQQWRSILKTEFQKATGLPVEAC